MKRRVYQPYPGQPETEALGYTQPPPTQLGAPITQIPFTPTPATQVPFTPTPGSQAFVPSPQSQSSTYGAPPPQSFASQPPPPVAQQTLPSVPFLPQTAPAAPPPANPPPPATAPASVPHVLAGQPGRRLYATKVDPEGFGGDEHLSQQFSSFSLSEQQAQQTQPMHTQPVAQDASFQPAYQQQPQPQQFQPAYQQQPQSYQQYNQQGQSALQSQPAYGQAGQPAYGQPGQPTYANQAYSNQAYNQAQGQPQLYGGAFGTGQPQAQAEAPLIKPLPLSQCPPKYLRMTLNAIPVNSNMLNKTALTLGCHVHPLAEPDPNIPDEQVPIVNFGAAGIVRCRRCRAYINPFVNFIDGGRRWQCNLCDLPNNVPNEYFSMLDATGRRVDVERRPELRNGCCEFIAPVEYMLKLAPQPPVYMFLIDVSYYSVASGMLNVLSETIKRTLEQIGTERTRVGFITFDSTLHFYNLKSSLSQPHMLVVSDLSEVFLPVSPEDLLVTFSDSKKSILSLAERLPTMFKNSKVVDSATGPALKAAFEIMNALGGKILLFQCALPSVGQGKLNNREDLKLLGSEKESQLLMPEGAWYKDFGLECSNKQISIDLYYFASQSSDLASLAPLTQYTTGQLFYYPGMLTQEEDARKFSLDIERNLIRQHGFEAVMRVRASKGLTMVGYYGNFFIRSSDLLLLPSIDSDKAFACKMTVSENLANIKNISIQSALLYTTSAGERRIRVMTVCLPVTQVVSDLFKHVDQDALVGLEAKIAIDKALSTKLSDATEYLLNKCIDVLAAYRAAFSTSANSNQILLPHSLKLLPLFTLSLLKNLLFRTGKSGEVLIKPSERTFLLHTFRILPLHQCTQFLYPRLYQVAGPSVTPEVGEEGPDGKVVLPPVLNLSSEKLDRRAAFLLDNGLLLFLWIGRDVDPELFASLCGADALHGAKAGQLTLSSDPSSVYAAKVKRIVAEIRKEKPLHQRLYVMRDGEPHEARFFGYLVEDKQKELPSYYEFILQLHKQVQARKI